MLEDNVAGLTQVSMVKPPPDPMLKLVAVLIKTRSLTPSKLNAVPTLPDVKPVPLTRVPLLAPTASSALFSPCHQPTRPDGASVQTAGEFTVNTALTLLVEPRTLETVTE